MVDVVRPSMVPVLLRKYAYRLLRSGSKPTSPVSDEKRSFSWKNAFCAVKTALRFAFASLCFDRAWNLMKFGIAIAARMPMIATTIISSISVKPFCTSFFIGAPLRRKHQSWSNRRAKQQIGWLRGVDSARRPSVGTNPDRRCRQLSAHPHILLRRMGHLRGTTLYMSMVYRIEASAALRR